MTEEWTSAVSTAYDNGLMSVHAYSRCWIHLIWGTLHRDRLLNKKAAAGLSRYLTEYDDEQAVYMKINFVNPDHVHVLIDLPTGFSIEKIAQLLKEVLPTGSIQANCLRKNLRGAEAMEHSRCHVPMWT